MRIPCAGRRGDRRFGWSRVGAIIGHQSGHGWEGAAIGAGAGALGGYIVGNEQDKAEQYRYNPNYDY